MQFNLKGSINMLIYEKKVEGVRHLFASTTGIPTESDTQLTYKDIDGDVLTLDEHDTYLDDKNGGIIRKSDEKFVAVFAGATNIIPGGFTPLEKVLDHIELSGTYKKNYETGDKLTLARLVVKGVYTSGDKEVITDYTSSPAAETVLSTSDTKVTITAQGKTAEFDITVVAAK